MVLFLGRITNEYAKNYEIELYIFGVLFNGENNKYKELNSYVNNWCVENEVSFTDPNVLLFNKNMLQNFFYDGVHLSDHGALCLGQIIFDKIKNKLSRAKLYFNQFSICHELLLQNKNIWSDYIDVNNKTTLSLWLDIKSLNNINYNSILYSVDYSLMNNDSVKSNLTFSKVAGWYSYIDLPKEGCEGMSCVNISIPEGVKRLRIGIRRWKNESEVYVKSCYIYKIEKDNA